MVIWTLWYIDPGSYYYSWYIEPPYWKMNPLNGKLNPNSILKTLISNQETVGGSIYHGRGSIFHNSGTWLAIWNKKGFDIPWAGSQNTIWYFEPRVNFSGVQNNIWHQYLNPCFSYFIILLQNIVFVNITINIPGLIFTSNALPQRPIAHKKNKAKINYFNWLLMHTLDN